MYNVLDAINAAAKSHLPATGLSNLKQVAIEPIQQSTEGPTLELVSSVLADLFSGISLETTAYRRGVTTTFVRHLLNGLIHVLSKVRGESIPEVSSLTEVQALEIVLSIRQRINIKFSRLAENRWKHSQKLAGTCDAAELKELTYAWSRLSQFGNINTPPTQATAKFIKGLHAVGIPVNRITVRINPHQKDVATSIAQSTSFLKQHFHQQYGAAPQFEKNKPRRGKSGRHGREPMYLQILTRSLKPGEVAPPALNDTQSLNALLLALLAYMNFNPQV